jgi:hypothetical protein
MAMKMQHVTSEDHLAQVLSAITTRLEMHGELIKLLRSEIPSLIDEYRYVASAQSLMVPPQTHNLEQIDQIICSVGPGTVNATLVLGPQRRIVLPPSALPGSFFIAGPFLLRANEDRILFSGTPENPGTAVALGLELMGKQRPTISL